MQPVIFRQGSGRVVSSVLRFATGTLTQSAGEAVYTPPGGGGGGGPWISSGYTGTASRLAGFDGTGAAAYYTGSTALDLVATTQGMIPVRGASTWSGLAVGASTYLLGSNGTDPLWKSPSTVKTDLSLNNVENTALSTWSGSTNLTTLGTIGTGTWQGSTLAIAYGGTGATTAGGARTALGLAIGSNVQAWGADLDALDALGDGLPYRGGGVWGATALGDLAISGGSMQVTQARGLREIAGPTNLSMGAVADGEVLRRTGTSIIGAAIGSVLQAYSAVLTAIAALGASGIIVRLTSSTVAVRSITGGANISVTNGDGTGGNPLLDVIGLDASTAIYGAIRPDGFNCVGVGITSSVFGTVTGITTNKYPASNVVASGASSISGVRTLTACHSMEQAITTKHAFVTDSNIASSRYWFGLSAALVGSSSRPSGATAAIVYDAAISANFQLCTYDGSAVSCAYTDTGLAVSTSTAYEAEIVVAAFSVSARIRVRGGTWSSTATYSGVNKPASTTKMYFIAATCSRSAVGVSTLVFLGASLTGLIS